VAPGQAVAVRGAGTAGGATVEDPRGVRRRLFGGAFRPERVGLYRVRAGGATTPLAVSLLSRDETLAAGVEARPPSDPWERAAASRGPTATAAVAWRMGGWLALVALCLVLAHGWLASAQEIRKIFRGHA